MSSSEKHTLDRIRKTCAEKEEYERSRKENYKSPSGFTILSRFMKDLNLEIINDFCEENNLSKQKHSELLDKYHKLNYYTPCVTTFLEKEARQFN